ncbi:hypothetical protein M8J75_000737 [Diaphorina citri]|nr:hypothetical protein M8J75_000737 [Diaphorina citri]
MPKKWWWNICHLDTRPLPVLNGNFVRLSMFCTSDSGYFCSNGAEAEFLSKQQTAFTRLLDTQELATRDL